MTQLAVKWDDGQFRIQKKLGDYVQFFQLGFPANSLGVPTKFVLPAPILEELLDYESTDDVPEEVLDMAAHPIEYFDGIPTIDGIPIWERMEGEPMQYYQLFKDYREMIGLYGTRSIARLAEQHQILGKYVGALAKVYSWGLRCKVYDAVRRIEAERKRQYEIEKLSSRHSAVAAKMLEQGIAYLEDHPEQMNPKIALQMVETAMKAGRLALGLTEKTGAATNINIQSGDSSAVSLDVNQEQAGSANVNTEISHLQSVLHILDQSGALAQAKGEVIEASYEEVDSPAD